MPAPLANWNPARDAWEMSHSHIDLFSGLSAVWSETWPSWGMWVDGVAYARPTSTPRTNGSASSSSPGLLPTPNAADGMGGPGNSGRDGGLNLRTAATLLPTPKATEGTKGGPNQRGSSGDLTLPSAAVQLLPTPTATPYGSNQSASSGAAVRPSLDTLFSTASPTTAHGAESHPRMTSPKESGAPVNALLPTPTAMDSHGSRGYKPDGTKYGPTSGFTLTDAALTPLPTPTRADGERTSKSYERGNPTLHGALTDLPSDDGNAA